MTLEELRDLQEATSKFSNKVGEKISAIIESEMKETSERFNLKPGDMTLAIYPQGKVNTYRVSVKVHEFSIENQWIIKTPKD